MDKCQIVRDQYILIDGILLERIRCVPLIAYELSIISKIMLLLNKELIDWNTSVCYEWKFVKKVNLTNKNSSKK